VHCRRCNHQQRLTIRLVVAVLRGDSKVSGTVTFEQASEGAETTVSWDITGHDANAERGMHVHAFGDNTNGCTSAGPHCEYPYSTNWY
jgi:Cu/Zn superoxide dismutase